jgi:hypothetical protein
MSTMPSREYEFSEQQNQLVGSLASSMRGVGFFLIVVAILNLVIALVVVLAIYRNRLPQNYVEQVLEKVKDATKTDVKAQLESLPSNNSLWGIAISALVNFLIYLCVGMWTQSAASSFQKIVDTKGNDISHLMDALSSLNKMYTLIWTLIVIGLVVLIVSAGLALWAHFAS